MYVKLVVYESRLLCKRPDLPLYLVRARAAILNLKQRRAGRLHLKVVILGQCDLKQTNGRAG